MADVYELSEAREEKENNLKSRRKRVVIALLVLVVLIAGLAVFSYYYNNRCFDSYIVKSQVDRSDSNNIGYLYYNKNLLKYSRSGISCVDNKGHALWNGGYEMKQPKVDINGKFVVAADVGGKVLYVYNGEDEGTEIDTTLPIVGAKVAANGVTAVLTQDSDSNVLNIYNPYNSADKLAVEIPTNVLDEGYPLDFDISPDGKSVVTSHMVLTGETPENKVSFYNFTEVGQDQNTLVGGKSFGTNTIASIEFVGKDEVCVFHSGGFTLFNQMKKPQIQAEVTYPDTIRSVAYSDQYIAVVTWNEGDTRNAQTLHLYNLKGKEIRSQNITYTFSDMELNGDELIFWSSKEAHILRTNGKEKFSCEFEDVIHGLFPTEQGSVYTLIDNNKINVISLKKK